MIQIESFPLNEKIDDPDYCAIRKADLISIQNFFNTGVMENNLVDKMENTMFSSKELLKAVFGGFMEISSVFDNKLMKFFIDKDILEEMRDEYLMQNNDISFERYLIDFENDPGAINHIGVWSETYRVMNSTTDGEQKENILFWYNLSQEWRLKCKEK